MARFRKLPPAFRRAKKPDRGSAWFIIVRRRKESEGAIATNVIVTQAGVQITTEAGETIIIE